jgi:hypothetical protein
VNTKKMLDRFIHQINAPSSCCYLSKVLLQKRSMSSAKVNHKKEVEKKWVLRCPPEKKEKRC